MKKILLLLLLLLLVGCKNKNVLTICNYNSNQKLNGYELNSEYLIYSIGDIVKKVEIKQVIKSNDDSILKKIEKSINEQYSINNVRYGGFRFTSKIDNKELTSRIIVNYDLLDMDKFIINNESMKEFVNDNNKFSLSGAKKLYKSIGANCK